MKLLGAFLRLIRYPNLFFIALTQSLFYFSVVRTTFSNAELTDPLGYVGILLLIIASILIAAGGYVINDYFDLNIDRINRPGKMVIERFIRRRSAIIWHLVLSFSGILISLFLSVKTGMYLPAVLNTASVLLLWFYSTSLKKKPILGNVVISLLTGWVVLVIYLYVHPPLFQPMRADEFAVMSRIYKFSLLYGGFAFIISMIREVIKDMEDMDGDEKWGRRTLPIVWGVPAAKLFISVWLIVLIVSLLAVQIYAVQLNWWFSIVYSVLFIILPMVDMFRKLNKAQSQNDFHALSMQVKLTMFTGILSMLFLFWHSL